MLTNTPSCQNNYRQLELNFNQLRKKPELKPKYIPLATRQAIDPDKISGGFHPNFCVYCGDFNQCRDHVTPISVESVYREYNRATTVDCCNQCNALAGDRWASTIIEKAEYLLGRYTIRYSKLLREPDWCDEEIQELSGNLREKVRARENLRRLVRLKLENLQISALGYVPTPIHNVLKFYFEGFLEKTNYVN
jgi:hypothetical protein